MVQDSSSFLECSELSSSGSLWSRSGGCPANNPLPCHTGGSDSKPDCAGSWVLILVGLQNDSCLHYVWEKFLSLCSQRVPAEALNHHREERRGMEKYLPPSSLTEALGWDLSSVGVGSLPTFYIVPLKHPALRSCWKQGTGRLSGQVITVFPKQLRKLQTSQVGILPLSIMKWPSETGNTETA